jgi:hypothetical protein
MALRGQGMVQMGTVRFHIGSADCTGCECSVVQQLLAWATMGHNSAIRQRCRQKNVGTPWESGGGHRPTVSPLMIPLVYCHIKSFQRALSMEKPFPGGENRRNGLASHHVAL